MKMMNGKNKKKMQKRNQILKINQKMNKTTN